MDEHDMITEQVRAELTPDPDGAEPLIYTTKGNLPISTLEYSHAWDDRPDAVVFSETYKLGDEVVKHAVHVLSKSGVTGEAIANPLGA